MVGPARPLAIASARLVRKAESTPETPTTLFPGFAPEAAAEQMERDGFAPGLMLPPGHVEAMREELARTGSSRCQDPHLKWPAASEVARDPAILELARRYFGAEPILFTSIVWLSTPSSPTEHQHRFHFDVADFRSMTVFFYLTDVDVESGPHTIIRGTHRRKGLSECGRIYLTDDEAERRFGDRIQVITGPRGTGFAEELTAYHKALPSKDQDRLMLGITYTLTRRPKSGRVVIPPQGSASRPESDAGAGQPMARVEQGAVA